MFDWPGSGSRSLDTDVSFIAVKSVSIHQLRFADDIAVRLTASGPSLLWLRGPSGCGKTTFLKQGVPQWPFPSLWLDLRRETEVMAKQPAIVDPAGMSEAPVLVLDDMTPRDLMILLSDPTHPASQVVPHHAGPILLVSEDVDDDAAKELSARIGRQLHSVDIPLTNFEQRLSILRAHQSRIERQMRVRISTEALWKAARGRASTTPDTPGSSLYWLEAASTRVCLRAMYGSPQLRALEAQIDDLNRALLVAQARGECVESLQVKLEQLDIEHAAYFVDWHEHQRTGEIYNVTASDIEHEIEAEIEEKGRLPESGDLAVDASVDSDIEMALG